MELSRWGMRRSWGRKRRRWDGKRRRMLRKRRKEKVGKVIKCYGRREKRVEGVIGGDGR